MIPQVVAENSLEGKISVEKTWAENNGHTVSITQYLNHKGFCLITQFELQLLRTVSVIHINLLSIISISFNVLLSNIFITARVLTIFMGQQQSRHSNIPKQSIQKCMIPTEDSADSEVPNTLCKWMPATSHGFHFRWHACAHSFCNSLLCLHLP